MRVQLNSNFLYRKHNFCHIHVSFCSPRKNTPNQLFLVEKSNLFFAICEISQFCYQTNSFLTSHDLRTLALHRLSEVNTINMFPCFQIIIKDMLFFLFTIAYIKFCLYFETNQFFVSRLYRQYLFIACESDGFLVTFCERH